METAGAQLLAEDVLLHRGRLDQALQQHLCPGSCGG
jgi:hypothetical protein